MASRCIIKFCLLLAFNFQNPTTNGKQGSEPEEIRQTLLSNRKPGNIDYRYASLTLLSNNGGGSCVCATGESLLCKEQFNT